MIDERALVAAECLGDLDSDFRDVDLE